LPARLLPVGHCSGFAGRGVATGAAAYLLEGVAILAGVLQGLAGGSALRVPRWRRIAQEKILAWAIASAWLSRAARETQELVVDLRFVEVGGVQREQSAEVFHRFAFCPQ